MQFKATPGFRLSGFLPRPTTLAACAMACGTCLASEHYLLSSHVSTARLSSLAFLKYASGHIVVAMVLLVVVGGALFVGEKDLISGFKNVRKSGKNKSQ